MSTLVLEEEYDVLDFSIVRLACLCGTELGISWVHVLAIWQHHMSPSKGLDSSCHWDLDPIRLHMSMLGSVASSETL